MAIHVDRSQLKGDVGIVSGDFLKKDTSPEIITDDEQTTEAVVPGSLSRCCFFSFRTSQPCVDVCPSTV